MAPEMANWPPDQAAHRKRTRRRAASCHWPSNLIVQISYLFLIVLVAAERRPNLMAEAQDSAGQQPQQQQPTGGNISAGHWPTPPQTSSEQFHQQQASRPNPHFPSHRPKLVSSKLAASQQQQPTSNNQTAASAINRMPLPKEAPVSRFGNHQREQLNYKTTYACEGNQMELSCQEGKLIHLVRANYGRFSLSICNELGHSNYSVQCASFRAFLLVETRCNKLTNCTVAVSTELFGDPCEGTSKYLEVQYYCHDEANNQNNKTAASNSAPVASSPTSRINAAATPTLSHKSPAQPAANYVHVGSSSSSSGGSTQSPPLDTETHPNVDSNVIQNQPPAPLAHCPAQLASRHTRWNSTRAGHSTRQICPDGADGRVSWFCDPERLRFAPSWGPDFSQCRTIWLARLSQQLEQMIEFSAGEQASASARQQDEQMARSILAEVSLVVRSRELFAEDLKRIDLMLSQTLEHLRRQQPQSQPQQQPALTEDTFAKVAQVVSSLLESRQRLAWLELGLLESRVGQQLELRLLGHLREAALMVSGGGARDFAPVRRPNLLVAARSVSSLAASPRANLLAGLQEASAEQEETAAGGALELPVDQVDEVRVPLRELEAIGVNKFLLIDIRRPDFWLAKQQLELEAQQQQPQLQQSIELPIIRTFGVFPLQEQRQQVDEQQIGHLLLQRPISVQFKLAAGAEPQQAAGAVANIRRDCRSQDPASKCHLAAANSTTVLCNCHKFAFVTLTSSVAPTQLPASSFYHQHEATFMSNFFNLNQWPATQQQQQQQQQQPAAGASDQLTHFDQRPAELDDSQLLVSTPTNLSTRQQTSGAWGGAALAVVATLLLVALAVSLVGTLVRFLGRGADPAAACKKQAPSSFFDSLSGPTSGPIATEHTLGSHHHLQQQQQQHHHHHHHVFQPQHLAYAAGPSTNSTYKQMYATSGAQLSSGADPLEGYTLSQTSGAGQYQYHSVIRLTPHESSARGRLLAFLRRPAAWLRRSTSSFEQPAKCATLASQEPVIPHTVIASPLAGGPNRRLAAAVHSLGRGQGQAMSQNGYTTTQQQQHHSQRPRLSQPAPGSDSTSCISTSAYYEEIGPGNLTRISTSQLVGGRAAELGVQSGGGNQLNSIVQQTLVDPLKRLQASCSPPADQQHLLSSSSSSSAGGAQIRHHATSHSNASSQQFAWRQEATGVAPPPPPAQLANDLTAARHYLFASPSAVSAYKQQQQQQSRLS